MLSTTAVSPNVFQQLLHALIDFEREVCLRLIVLRCQNLVWYTNKSTNWDLQTLSASQPDPAELSPTRLQTPKHLQPPKALTAIRFG